MREVVMEEGGDLSGCSSSTTTLDDDLSCAWVDWSPIVDWRMLSDTDDLHGLIESMILDKNMDDEERNMLVRSRSTSSLGVPIKEEEEEQDSKGLRLVHLLMAAAEALEGAPKNHGWDLARVILVRLKELVPSSGTIASGSNMERLSVQFADALQALLLDGSTAGAGTRQHRHEQKQQHHSSGDVLAAFQLLQDMSPCVKFGHFTANQAILEAVACDRRVHILDYDIVEGIQWASLMQALVTKKDGLSPPHLRITAVTRSTGGRRISSSIAGVQETGRRLAAFAASIGQPFSFSQCRLDTDDKFRAAGVRVVKGEALIVNTMLHLPHSPHRSPASIASFLKAAATSLAPRLITLVEEEENEPESEQQQGFIPTFMQALHRYSAVWDSLEAGFPMQRRARALVERAFLGPRIAGEVKRAFKRSSAGGEMQQEKGWGEWLAAAGFRRGRISFFNHCQARLLLGLFHEGYRVQEAAPNKLVLGWKSRPLLSASVWSAPVAASPGVKELSSNINPEDFNVFRVSSS